VSVKHRQPVKPTHVRVKGPPGGPKNPFEAVHAARDALLAGLEPPAGQLMHTLLFDHLPTGHSAGINHEEPDREAQARQIVPGWLTRARSRSWCAGKSALAQVAG
jgi:hypothetical protein